MCYKVFMVIQSIREFNRATPFKPYRIRMVSGETYDVPHPDFLSISPKGSFVVFFESDESPHHLSAILIESVSQIRSNRQRGSARKP
jgi:hypothetical protein